MTKTEIAQIFAVICVYVPFQNCSSFQKSFLGVDSCQRCAQKDSHLIVNWKSTKCVEIVFFARHCLAMTCFISINSKLQ